MVANPQLLRVKSIGCVSEDAGQPSSCRRPRLPDLGVKFVHQRVDLHARSAQSDRLGRSFLVLLEHQVEEREVGIQGSFGSPEGQDEGKL